MFPLSETSNKFYRYFGLVTVVIIGVVSIVGSGGSGGGENPPPTITSVSPAQSSDSALVTALVEAQFSIDMDETSVENSFTLTEGGIPVAANVVYDSVSKIATLQPTSDLTSGQQYFATIADSVQDATLNTPLTSDYVWSFWIAPTLVPVSLDSNGVFGNANSITSDVDATGRYIAFASKAPNIGCGSSAFQQICRKDTVSGEVTLVSTSGGLEGNSDSSSPVISADGNYVAFVSTSSNLCSGDPVITQICRKNLTTGALELVSATVGAIPGNNEGSNSPSISADGNYVAFASTSSNLCSGTIATPQICRKNMTSDAIDLVSATAGATPGDNEGSSSPSISADGNYVAFVSTSSNLCSGTIATPQICRKNLITGDVALVSEDLTPAPAPGTSASSAPSISSNGNYVAFVSTSNNLCSGAPLITQICRKNITSGAVELVSATATTPAVAGNSASSAPSISSDGTYVAFASTADNISCSSGGISQICLKDMTSGSGGPIQLISDANPYAPVDQADGACTAPQISDNGRYISFSSIANNLGSSGSIDQIYRGAR